MHLQMEIWLEISMENIAINDNVQSTPVLKYRETEGRKDIGTQFWNQGRTEEIKDRVLHL